MAVVRDYIPAGEELTEAEKARLFVPPHAIGKRETHKRDFIPDEHTPKVKDLSPEQKQQLARESARAAVERDRDTAMDIAKAKLQTMNVGAAIDFIEGLGMYERAIYVQAELEGQARVGVLKQFPPKAYIPAKEPEKE